MSVNLKDLTNNKSIDTNKDLSSYEDKGIIFFNEQPLIDIYKFAAEHEDCNIILSKLIDGKRGYIVAYAKSPEYNKNIVDVASKNGDWRILHNPFHEIEEGVVQL